MNLTVARLTTRTVLGRRRFLLLVLLPLVLVGLCVLVRVLSGVFPDLEGELYDRVSADILGSFGLAILLPLLGLIAGTGSIGSEIDDGSIVYLLAKPVSRHSIVVSKLVVAVGVVVAFGVLPVAIGGLILTGELGGLTAGFTAGTLAAGVAYAAVFLLLSVLTRNAVIVGLIYALVWESLVGQVVPGAQALSVQQWGLSLTEAVVGDRAPSLGIVAAVSLPVGLTSLAVVTVVGTWYAGHRLRSLRLTED